MQARRGDAQARDPPRPEALSRELKLRRLRASERMYLTLSVTLARGFVYSSGWGGMRLPLTCCAVGANPRNSYLDR